MTLFIDTTDNDLVKITLLVKDKKFSKQWRTRRLSETLMPQISALIEKNKKKISDLKKIIVVRGPGFFSRVRTGVATALAYGLNIRVAGVEVGQKEKKFSRLVLPFYQKPPNITKSKR